MKENLQKYGVVIGIIFLLAVVLVLSNQGTPTELVLGDYLNLDVEVTLVSVSDEDVTNGVIDDVVASQDDVEITDRAVRSGDTVNIDYSGAVDGEVFENGTATDYDLEIGSGALVDGFEDQIIGHDVGETFDINVTFPDSYDEALAGKDAVFTITINSITGKEIPDEITDDMIAEISDDYDNVATYREYVRGVLEEEAEEENETLKQDAVWAKVVDNTTVVTISSKKIDYYENLYKNNYEYYAEVYGVTLSDLVTTYMGMTMTDFNIAKNKYATELATVYEISSAIADEKDLSVSDEDYKDYLDDNDMTESDNADYEEATKDELLYQKVIELIASNTNFITE
ncbi:MAG: FKBP-type peptidyl-prolyl cis-trans isomerase [Bacilli bacterium]|nr:FKBP-type peptidyl-prolyl cis-trans isomerase [Bacilli bacterium]